MKITTIPQLYRNLRRWREILAVLRRYGLADWLSQHRGLPFRGLYKDHRGTPLAEYTREQRVRMALTDLGPTFIKLGQILAARPDLVGPVLSEELKGLRVNVRPDSIETVRKTLASEFGENYEDAFQMIDAAPLATASIGQVHRAVLRDGRPVVVKVLRAGIEKTVRQDIEVLSGLAMLASRVEALAAWRPVDVVRQLAPIITRELDFSRERQSLEYFAGWLKRRGDQVIVPIPVTELCTRRVLVMDELKGRSLASCLRSRRPMDHQHGHQPDRNGSAEREAPQASPAARSGETAPGDAGEQPVAASETTSHPSHQGNGKPDHGTSAGNRELADIVLDDATRTRLSEMIADVYVAMIFDEGVFHADPHPGNLFCLRDGRLGILDFGMTGRIDENLRENIEDMLVAISSGDQNRLIRLIRRVGEAPMSLDESALAIDVADFIATYGQQSISNFDLTGALNALTEVLHQHSIKLPNQSALLLKMMISLEGTLRELGASFDSLQVIQSLAKKSTMRRLSPKRRLRQARRIYLEAESFLESAPDEFISLLQMVRRGETSVTLEHRRLGPSVNRLVLGLMASSVFVGSSLMLAHQVPPRLGLSLGFVDIEPVSLIGLLGIFGSISVMLWLLLAIARSGHLTRNNED
ncbi:AarF/ABC1/UbiB kinase family protein [Roseiconus nitratireducens]|uniref:AarF/ABC1/UbiB kinase family protein n=1 Tax=Roseiconus nitratireducens TaxID=2605748 RepID=A0A5M6D6C6_9BACT|nr:AarF/UbiB family protein [Roseiconus nitratireducens]KAA5543078.1 AarF/ABC1/UbiB kinase family protein [Roseiconus nitratireducens]